MTNQQTSPSGGAGAAQPVALITGATRGIGLAIARELARTHTLILGGTKEESVTALCQEIPGSRAFVADLTDDTAVKTALNTLAIDRLDVVVLNAGIVTGSTVEKTTRQEWTQIFDVNVVSQAALVQELLPALRAAKGQVVAINSGSGHTSHAGNAPYCASKFALRAFTDALREEERGSVRVCSVHPGRVDTDMQREIQAGRGMGSKDYDGSIYIQPESIAAAVRTAVDARPECTVEEIRVRPVKQ